MSIADPTTVQYCAQCRREVPTAHTRAAGWAFAPGVVLTYDGRAYCSGACHAARRDATLAKFEAGRAERRARAEAELLSPSFPPKCPLGSYPKRGPNRQLATTTDLGDGMATVSCGSHTWTEVTFPSERQSYDW